MSKSTASVGTADLAAVLDYLGGLQMILELFHDDDAENNHADVATAALSLHNRSGAWEPLRYDGTESGMGWDLTAGNIGDLRARLRESYRDAAQ
jgi:hypothetical protein